MAAHTFKSETLSRGRIAAVAAGIVLAALWSVAAASTAVASTTAAAAGATATDAGNAGRQDLFAVQGTWEREEPVGSGAPYRRAVKDIKGNEESVAYYRGDGSLWRAHRAQFSLSRSGDVKVFTFRNARITDGDSKGARIGGPASYIYVATDTHFKEVRGFLPGQEAQPPSLLVWRRARDEGAEVAAAPAPDARLQGEWKPFHSEEGGADRLDRGVYRVTVEGDVLTIVRDGRLMLRGTMKTYAGRNPARIDLLLLEDADNPANAGRTLRGIYALKGDELRWCTGTTAASQYPADFVTREGAPYILVVMRRKPAKQG